MSIQTIAESRVSLRLNILGIAKAVKLLFLLSVSPVASVCHLMFEE